MNSISLLVGSFQYCDSDEDITSLKVLGSFSTKNVKPFGPKKLMSFDSYYILNSPY